MNERLIVIGLIAIRQSKPQQIFQHKKLFRIRSEQLRSCALKSTFLIRKAFLNQESTTTRRHFEFRTSLNDKALFTMDKPGNCNVNHTLKAAKFQIVIAHYSVYTSQQKFQDILLVVQCPIQQRKEREKMTAVGKIGHLSFISQER